MKIAVFGAGLVGSLYALLMAKAGHKIEVYEKRPDIRKGTKGRSRSINLALSTRGKTALEKAGILEEVFKLCIPMSGRMVHKISEKTQLQPYSVYNDSIDSVSRNFLNELLIHEAEKTGNCNYFFNSELLPCKNDHDLPNIVLENKEVISPKVDFYLGADGVNSICRTYIKDNNFRLEKISHQYKEIEFPDNNGKHILDKNALHIWPRGEYMFIGLPNLDGSFTGTLFLPEEGVNSFAELKTAKDVNDFFVAKFPDTSDLIPDLVDQFFKNPSSNLGTVWVDKWYDDRKKIGIIGDAAHGVVPFYGQGMNTGFEDCRLLFELIEKEGFESHFEKFVATRKEDTDAIAKLSINNFIEMRDLVAQPKFILQKKIEGKIQEMFPSKWMPLYSMVSFSNIPYSVVYNKSLVQQNIMDQIMQIQDIEEKANQESLAPEILSILSTSFYNSDIRQV